MHAPVIFAPRSLERAVDALFGGANANAPDFSLPRGAQALIPADSISWRLFKNPVTLFIGGVTAVILEFAEPRVRDGVWQHSSFRSAPMTRLTRTGLAAMTTVYGTADEARSMIAGVNRMHGKVRGETSDGTPYHALDPELLDWVQATAGYGFIMAYHRFARSLSPVEIDRAFAEAQPAALLYGATGAPVSRVEFDELHARLAPRFEPSPIIGEFLDMMKNVDALPKLARPVQHMLVRAAVDLLPKPLPRLLELENAGLRAGENVLVRAAGRAADSVILRSSPAVQACRRLGLPDDYLYRDPVAKAA